jgi:hypothetical protein
MRIRRENQTESIPQHTEKMTWKLLPQSNPWRQGDVTTADLPSNGTIKSMEQRAENREHRDGEVRA